MGCNQSKVACGCGNHIMDHDGKNYCLPSCQTEASIEKAERELLRFKARQLLARRKGHLKARGYKRGSKPADNAREHQAPMKPIKKFLGIDTVEAIFDRLIPTVVNGKQVRPFTEKNVASIEKDLDIHVGKNNDAVSERLITPGSPLELRNKDEHDEHQNAMKKTAVKKYVSGIFSNALNVVKSEELTTSCQTDQSLPQLKDQANSVTLDNGQAVESVPKMINRDDVRFYVGDVISTSLDIVNAEKVSAVQTTAVEVEEPAVPSDEIKRSDVRSFIDDIISTSLDIVNAEKVSAVQTTAVEVEEPAVPSDEIKRSDVRSFIDDIISTSLDIVNAEKLSAVQTTVVEVEEPAVPSDEIKRSGVRSFIDDIISTSLDIVNAEKVSAVQTTAVEVEEPAVPSDEIKRSGVRSFIDDIISTSLDIVNAEKVSAVQTTAVEVEEPVVPSDEIKRSDVRSFVGDIISTSLDIVDAEKVSAVQTTAVEVEELAVPSDDINRDDVRSFVDNIISTSLDIVNAEKVSAVQTTEVEIEKLAVPSDEIKRSDVRSFVDDIISTSLDIVNAEKLSAVQTTAVEVEELAVPSDEIKRSDVRSFVDDIISTSLDIVNAEKLSAVQTTVVEVEEPAVPSDEIKRSDARSFVDDIISTSLDIVNAEKVSAVQTTVVEVEEPAVPSDEIKRSDVRSFVDDIISTSLDIVNAEKLSAVQTTAVEVEELAVPSDEIKRSDVRSFVDDIISTSLDIVNAEKLSAVQTTVVEVEEPAVPSDEIKRSDARSFVDDIISTSLDIVNAEKVSAVQTTVVEVEEPAVPSDEIKRSDVRSFIDNIISTSLDIVNAEKVSAVQTTAAEIEESAVPSDEIKLDDVRSYVSDAISTSVDVHAEQSLPQHIVLLVEEDVMPKVVNVDEAVRSYVDDIIMKAVAIVSAEQALAQASKMAGGEDLEVSEIDQPSLVLLSWDDVKVSVDAEVKRGPEVSDENINAEDISVPNKDLEKPEVSEIDQPSLVLVNWEDVKVSVDAEVKRGPEVKNENINAEDISVPKKDLEKPEVSEIDQPSLVLVNWDDVKVTVDAEIKRGPEVIDTKVNEEDTSNPNKNLDKPEVPKHEELSLVSVNWDDVRITVDAEIMKGPELQEDKINEEQTANPELKGDSELVEAEYIMVSWDEVEVSVNRQVNIGPETKKVEVDLTETSAKQEGSGGLEIEEDQASIAPEPKKVEVDLTETSAEQEGSGGLEIDEDQTVIAPEPKKVEVDVTGTSAQQESSGDLETEEDERVIAPEPKELEIDLTETSAVQESSEDLETKEDETVIAPESKKVEDDKIQVPMKQETMQEHDVRKTQEGKESRKKQKAKESKGTPRREEQLFVTESVDPVVTGGKERAVAMGESYAITDSNDAVPMATASTPSKVSEPIAIVNAVEAAIATIDSNATAISNSSEDKERNAAAVRGDRTIKKPTQAKDEQAQDTFEQDNDEENEMDVSIEAGVMSDEEEREILIPDLIPVFTDVGKDTLDCTSRDESEPLAEKEVLGLISTVMADGDVLKMSRVDSSSSFEETCSSSEDAMQQHGQSYDSKPIEKDISIARPDDRTSLEPIEGATRGKDKGLQKIDRKKPKHRRGDGLNVGPRVCRPSDRAAENGTNIGPGEASVAKPGNGQISKTAEILQSAGAREECTTKKDDVHDTEACKGEATVARPSNGGVSEAAEKVESAKARQEDTPKNDDVHNTEASKGEATIVRPNDGHASVIENDATHHHQEDSIGGPADRVFSVSSEGSYEKSTRDETQGEMSVVRPDNARVSKMDASIGCRAKSCFANSCSVEQEAIKNAIKHSIEEMTSVRPNARSFRKNGKFRHRARQILKAGKFTVGNDDGRVDSNVGGKKDRKSCKVEPIKAENGRSKNLQKDFSLHSVEGNKHVETQKDQLQVNAQDPANVANVVAVDSGLLKSENGKDERTSSCCNNESHIFTWKGKLKSEKGDNHYCPCPDQVQSLTCDDKHQSEYDTHGYSKETVSRISGYSKQDLGEGQKGTVEICNIESGNKEKEITVKGTFPIIDKIRQKEKEQIRTENHDCMQKVDNELETCGPTCIENVVPPLGTTEEAKDTRSRDSNQVCTTTRKSPDAISDMKGHKDKIKVALDDSISLRPMGNWSKKLRSQDDLRNQKSKAFQTLNNSSKIKGYSDKDVESKDNTSEKEDASPQLLRSNKCSTLPDSSKIKTSSIDDKKGASDTDLNGNNNAHDFEDATLDSLPNLEVPAIRVQGTKATDHPHEEEPSISKDDQWKKPPSVEESTAITRDANTSEQKDHKCKGLGTSYDDSISLRPMGNWSQKFLAQETLRKQRGKACKTSKSPTNTRSSDEDNGGNDSASENEDGPSKQRPDKSPNLDRKQSANVCQTLSDSSHIRSSDEDIGPRYEDGFPKHRSDTCDSMKRSSVDDIGGKTDIASKNDDGIHKLERKESTTLDDSPKMKESSTDKLPCTKVGVDIEEIATSEWIQWISMTTIGTWGPKPFTAEDYEKSGAKPKVRKKKKKIAKKKPTGGEKNKEIAQKEAQPTDGDGEKKNETVKKDVEITNGDTADGKKEEPVSTSVKKDEAVSTAVKKDEPLSTDGRKNDPVPTDGKKDEPVSTDGRKNDPVSTDPKIQESSNNKLPGKKVGVDIEEIATSEWIQWISMTTIGTWGPKLFTAEDYEKSGAKPKVRKKKEKKKAKKKPTGGEKNKEIAQKEDQPTDGAEEKKNETVKKDVEITNGDTVDSKKEEPVSTSVKKNEPVSTDSRKDDPVSTDGRKDDPVSTDDRKDDPVSTDGRKDDPVSTDGRKDDPVPTDGRKDDPVSTDDRKDDPVSTDDRKDDPVSTDDRKDDPVPTDGRKDDPVSTDGRKDDPVPTDGRKDDPVSTECKKDEPVSTDDKEKDIESQIQEPTSINPPPFSMNSNVEKRKPSGKMETASRFLYRTASQVVKEGQKIKIPLKSKSVENFKKRSLESLSASFLRIGRSFTRSDCKYSRLSTSEEDNDREASVAPLRLTSQDETLYEKDKTKTKKEVNKIPKECDIEDIMLAIREFNQVRQVLGLDGPVSTALVYKFLFARDYDVDDATQLYKNYLSLRRVYHNAKLSPLKDPLHQELYNGSFTILNARDEHGSAIAVFTAQLHKADISHEVVMNNIYIQLDEAINSFDIQKTGIILIYDFSNISYKNCDVHLCSNILELFQSAYPVRLKKTYIVSPPFWFEPEMRLFSASFRDTNKRKNIRIVTQSKLKTQLLSKCIPRGLGGECEVNPMRLIKLCITSHKDRLGLMENNSKSSNTSEQDRKSSAQADMNVLDGEGQEKVENDSTNSVDLGD